MTELQTKLLFRCRELKVKFRSWSEVSTRFAPWLLRRFGWNVETTWMTLGRTILHPNRVSNPIGDCPTTCAHELEHVTQQLAALCVPWWLIRYVVSDKFRLKMERAAFLVDIKNGACTVANASRALAHDYRIDCATEEEIANWFTHKLEGGNT